jgi:hypothetical protein
MRKILEQCPTCGGGLYVSELSCAACDTRVSGRFYATRFARLSADALHFLEIFVKNRGNVKEMERELDLSYWSIRNKLNHVIDELGFAEDAPTGMRADVSPAVPPATGQEQAAKAARQTVLDRLDRGEISVQEAAGRLTEIRQGHS